MNLIDVRLAIRDRGFGVFVMLSPLVVIDGLGGIPSADGLPIGARETDLW